MENAIAYLRKAVVTINYILMYLIGLALVIGIIFPNDKLLHQFGIGQVFTKLGHAGFSGFIAFILFVAIFNYLRNKD